MQRLAVVPIVLALAAGCARPPVPLRGEFPPITVAEAQAVPRDGELVRWGGEIVNTTPEDDGGTCIEIVQKPLDDTARPRPIDITTGRFLACAPSFYDPAVYAPKRDVTVVGALEASREGKVGERSYAFPVVRTNEVFLWPPREPVVNAGYYSPWYVGPTWYPGFYGYPYWYGGPFWGGGPYWGGGYWGGGWGRPGWRGWGGGWGGRGWGGHGWGGRGPYRGRR